VFRRKKKLTIEEEIRKNLSGELIESALDFIAYMNETFGFTENPDGTSGWYHLGERICFHVICPNQFLIFFGHQSIVSTSDFDSFPISDELKEFTWSSVNVCRYCPGEMPVGMTIQSNPCRQGDNIIFGKKFDNLCNCPIGWINPDAKTLEKIKELAVAWKHCIAELKK